MACFMLLDGLSSSEKASSPRFSHVSYPFRSVGRLDQVESKRMMRGVDESFLRSDIGVREAQNVACVA